MMPLTSLIFSEDNRSTSLSSNPRFLVFPIPDQALFSIDSRGDTFVSKGGSYGDDGRFLKLWLRVGSAPSRLRVGGGVETSRRGEGIEILDDE